MLIKPAIERSDMIYCALCKDAPYNSASLAMDPARALLGIWFDNQDVAAMKLPEKNACADCSAPCEKALSE